MSTVTLKRSTATRRAPVEDLPPANLAPSRKAKVIGIAVLIIALLYFILPIIWVMFSATKSNADLVSTPGFWFGDFQLTENYHKLMEWTQGNFWRWVGNSILYSTVAGVVGTLVSVAAGYALAKFRFPGSRLMSGTIMAGLLMPVAILTVPLYIVFLNIGLANTAWAVIIPSCVSPFGVFLGRVFADAAVPTEVLEAARIDGASEARIFFTMVLRLLAPAMVTIFLFIFVATWNNFLLPLMMISSPELKPVTLGLYGMMSYFAPQKGAVMLGALLGVIPLIIMFLALQRYWRSGLAAGAVKG
ncbi:MAG: carbohydrate ABC transporter permease [Demequina sp.]|uniref:carbohydrate ABC transporter permease n=1 Tax=Demequina sp. TaxID=2050685 RepID=UPI003A88C31B